MVQKAEHAAPDDSCKNKVQLKEHRPTRRSRSRARTHSTRTTAMPTTDQPWNDRAAGSACVDVTNFFLGSTKATVWKQPNVFTHGPARGKMPYPQVRDALDAQFAHLESMAPHEAQPASRAGSTLPTSSPFALELLSHASSPATSQAPSRVSQPFSRLPSSAGSVGSVSSCASSASSMRHCNWTTNQSCSPGRAGLFC